VTGTVLTSKRVANSDARIFIPATLNDLVDLS
jgi:hypothetical protein